MHTPEIYAVLSHPQNCPERLELSPTYNENLGGVGRKGDTSPKVTWLIRDEARI